MQSVNLTHHFLIAMPTMADPHFSKTLTYICEHNDQGALGLVVNRPIDMTLAKLLEQVSIPARPATAIALRSTTADRCRQTAASCCTARVGNWQSDCCQSARRSG